MEPSNFVICHDVTYICTTFGNIYFHTIYLLEVWICYLKCGSVSLKYELVELKCGFANLKYGFVVLKYGFVDLKYGCTLLYLLVSVDVIG